MLISIYIPFYQLTKFVIHSKWRQNIKILITPLYWLYSFDAVISSCLIMAGDEFVTNGDTLILSPYRLLTLSPSAKGENKPPEI